jgi:hypothetical protein
LDHREIQQESGFVRDLKSANKEEYIDYSIEESGKSYRIPYKMVREMTITNIDKTELKDIPHTARVQYRLLLLDAVLKAKIEFIRGKATLTYNPVGEANSKEKMSRDDVIRFFAEQGVHIDPKNIVERDVDYIEEIYKPQFDPAQIREHAPYGYTREEWKRMKPDYIKKTIEGEQKKQEKFHAWQDSYISRYPEMAKEYGISADKPKKKGLLARLTGRDRSEKGYWFHGV